jgi:hypothetical protein
MFWNSIRFDIARSDGPNYHGPNDTTLRRCFKLVRMGSYAKMWSIYRYHNGGGWTRYTVTFPRWQGPWPASAGNEPNREMKR